jgi:uncharacterized delta-60 repeat protein
MMEQRVLLSAGLLDNTFGTGGSVQIPGGGAPIYGAAVAALPNGQSVLLFSVPLATPGAAQGLQVERLLPNGSIDTTFGKNGSVTVPGFAASTPGTLLVEPDGTLIVAAGRTLARLTRAGALDTTFANGKGYEELPAFEHGAVLQSDGKIDVLTGNSGTIYDGAASVYRYTTAGALDTTYGTKGVAVIGNDPGGIALDSSGRAVVSFGGPGSENLGEFYLERLTTTGAVDKTFGTKGIANDGGEPDDAFGSTVAIAPNGTIYLAANYDEDEDSDQSLIDVFNSSGVKTGGGDNTFFQGGILSMVVQPDNKLLAAGYVFQNEGGNTNVIVERFNDKTFGTNGSTQIDFTPGDDNRGTSYYGDYGFSLALQPDGKILVAGSTYNENNDVISSEFTLSRLTNDITSANSVIKGTVFHDANSNRVQDSAEKGLAGWTVYIDLSDDNAVSNVDPVTTTDASGNYSFSGLVPGTYVVRAIPPQYWVQTTPTNPYGLKVTVGLNATVTGGKIGFAALPGAIDPTFGANGTAAPIGGAAAAVAVQSNGDIVFAGPTTSAWEVTRLTPAGALDKTFGTGGNVQTTIDSSGVPAVPSALLLQKDSKIVVGGTAIGDSPTTESEFALARYLSTGKLDTSFGTGGIVRTLIPSPTGTTKYVNATLTAMTLQSDGKIVAVGYAYVGTKNNDYRFVVVRYNSNGTLDTTFGSGGVVVTPLFLTGDYARAVTLEPNGQIVVGGSVISTHPPTLDTDFALVRYNTNGTIDKYFGTNGIVMTDFNGKNDEVTSLAVDKSGRLLASGGAFELAGYMQNGQLDPKFGVGGKVTVTAPLQNALSATALVLQSDGKIVMAGVDQVSGFKGVVENYGAVARLTSAGKLDTTFATNGLDVLDFGATPPTTLPAAVALDAAGDIVLAGPDGDVIGAGALVRLIGIGG